MSEQNTAQKSRPRTIRQLLKARSKDQRRLSKLERMPPELLERVLELIRLGATDYVAATALGIARSTWTKWMSAGEQALEEGELDNIYGMFYSTVMEARSNARVLAEASVKASSPIRWLTTMAREDWSETARVAFEGRHEHHGSVDFNVIPVDTVAEGLEYLQELGLLAPTELGAKLLPVEDVESTPTTDH